MATPAQFYDQNGELRLDGTLVGGGGALPSGWTETGSPADVETNGGGLNVELAGSGLFVVTDLTSAQGLFEVANGAVRLKNTAPNTYLSGGLNNLDLSMPSAIGRLTLDDFSGNDLIKITDPGKLGFYGAAPTAQPTGVPVTAAGIHAALVALGLITA